jgi:hypothetical protein
MLLLNSCFTLKWPLVRLIFKRPQLFSRSIHRLQSAGTAVHRR